MSDSPAYTIHVSRGDETWEFRGTLAHGVQAITDWLDTLHDQAWSWYEVDWLQEQIAEQLRAAEDEQTASITVVVPERLTAESRDCCMCGHARVRHEDRQGYTGRCLSGEWPGEASIACDCAGFTGIPAEHA